MFTLPEETKNRWKPILPFLLLFLLMLLFHALLWEDPDLDTARYFAKVLRKQTLWEFLSMRYEVWSSRLFIDGLLTFFAKHLALWKLVDALLFPLLSASLSYLLTGGLRNTRMNWIVSGAVLLYPFGEMQSAGWTATTMNYFWPLVFGVFSCTIGAGWLYTGKRPKWWHTILAIPAALFACNMEQMCGVLLAVFLVLFLMIRKKYGVFSFELLLLLLSDIANLVLILLCPGNRNRLAEEMTMSQIEGFAGMNAAEKFIYALNDTCIKMVNEGYLFMIVSVALFILVCLKTKSLIKRLISLFPAMLILYRFVFSAFLPSTTLLLLEDPVLSEGTAFQQSAWAILFLWILLMTALALSVSFLGDTKTDKVLMPLLFFVGLCSRLIVGLSPSLENSANRTFIYFDFVLLFLMLWGIGKLSMDGAKKRDVLRLMYGGAVILSVINTFSFAARLTMNTI